MPQNEYSKNIAFAYMQFTESIQRHLPECQSSVAHEVFGQKVVYAHDRLQAATKLKYNTYCDLSELSACDVPKALLAFELQKDVEAVLHLVNIVEPKDRQPLYEPIGQMLSTKLNRYITVAVPA